MRLFGISTQTCLYAWTPMHPEAPHSLVQTISAWNVLVTKMGLWVPLNQVLGSSSPGSQADRALHQKSGSFESRVLDSTG